MRYQLRYTRVLLAVAVGDGFRRRPIVAAGLRLSKRELDDRLLVWHPVRESNPPLRLEGPRTSPEVQRDRNENWYLVKDSNLRLPAS